MGGRRYLLALAGLLGIAGVAAGHARNEAARATTAPHKRQWKVVERRYGTKWYRKG